MDVFDLRTRLVNDYARYTRSFIRIADPRINERVEGALNDGVLCPSAPSGSIRLSCSAAPSMTSLLTARCTMSA